MFNGKKWLIVLMVMLAASLCPATVYYVNGGSVGNDANDGDEWGEAFKTLTYALTQASSGDEIWVAEGTYKPGATRSSSFQLVSGVELYGGFDPANGDDEWSERDYVNNVTILSGDIGTVDSKWDNCYHVVKGSNTDSTAIIDGFTITKGFANGSGSDLHGGGMLNADYTSSPTVSNCIFTGNEALGGAGMWNDTSSCPTITNCTFVENTGYPASSDGGGIVNYYHSNATITDCTFIDNTAGYGGGMCNYLWSDPNVINCTFIGNTATVSNAWGGGMCNYNHSSPTVSNCIFLDNTADRGGGMGNCYFASPTVINSVFANNSAGTGGGMWNDYDTPVITNCTFSKNTASTGNGGGISNYESGDAIITNCIVWDNNGSEIYNNSSTPVVTYCDVEGGYTGTGNINNDPCFVDADSNDFHLDVNSPCLNTGDPNGDYDGQTDIDGDTRLIGAAVDIGADEDPNGGYIYYVDSDANGSNDGSSWADAYTDLQDALGDANTNDEIWVAAGTYKPGTSRSSTFQLVSGVELYGGFDPDTDDDTWAERDYVNNVTILSGDIGTQDDTSDNCYHVVYNAGVDSTTIIDGFTITKGNANGSSTNAHGGGMCNDYQDSNPTVNNCIFTANIAIADGGGMFNYYSSPTIIDCTFSDNTSAEAGGMANLMHSSPTITNCTFTNNSATSNWGGGGICNYYQSDPVITSCTFTDNTAAQSGGGINNLALSDATITDCNFTGNTAGANGGAIFNDNESNPILTRCTFTDNTAYYGGAIYNDTDNDPTVTNCTFADNTAYYCGGGIYNTRNYATIRNCIFASNAAGWDGGGVYSYFSTPVVTNCTFAKNTSGYNNGTGMYNYYSSTVTTNCTFWDNDGSQIYDAAGSPVVTYSDVEGGYTGTGNINSDPCFVDADSNDFHLDVNSPCIDTGDPNTDSDDVGDYDLDGDDRFVDGDSNSTDIIDQGCYEYQTE